MELQMDDVETWKSLVKCRKAQNGANIPRNFTFLDHRFLLFLGIDTSLETDNPTSQLYYVDLSTDNKTSSSTVTHLEWKPLSNSLLNSLEQLSTEYSESLKEASKEEELLRERQRRSFEGLYSFSFHRYSQRLLLPQGVRLDVFSYSLSNSSSLEESFRLLNSYLSSEGYLDPKWSPDGRYISFIRNGNIWLLSLHNSLEVQLTFSENYVSSGVADYIMQEEFDRFTGYWWAPSLVHSSADCSYYCILYLEVDQSMVPLHRGIRWNTKMEAEEMRYPRVGDPNVIAEPRVLFLPSLENNLLTLDNKEAMNNTIKTWKPQRSIYEQFPWAEYVVRGGWLTDDSFSNQLDISWNNENREDTKHSSSSYKNGFFWLALLNRSQQHLAIVLFDIHSDSGEGVVLWEERQPQWINVPDFILFLHEDTELSAPTEDWISAMKYDDGFDPNNIVACITCPQQRIESKHLAKIPQEINFLMSSEVDGYAHLYYNQVRFSTQDSYTECQLYYQPLTVIAMADNDPHSLSLITSIRYVDQRKGHIYFIGICKLSLERHLYLWKKPGIVQRLTDGDINCMECYFREDSNRIVIQSSSLTQFPETYIIDKEETLDEFKLIAKWKIENRPLHPHLEFPVPRNPPLLFHFQVEKDVTLYGCLYLPPQLQMERPSATKTIDIHSLSHYIPVSKGSYPLLLIVYGGPHVQLVSNDYRLTAQLKYQYLASQGIICMMLDNRGSLNRGHEFETRIYQKLGQIEVNDQIAALQVIVGQGFVDPTRTAVFGWSYGGYMSLMLFAKHSNLFRIAIAGAPVVNWEDYDSGYTERYMGLLSKNAQGYSESSVRNWVGQLPNEEGRLFLVHSLSDENVHPQHTFQLVDSLIQQGKPYTLYLFPRERHGLRELSSQVYFEHCFGKILYRWIMK
ncbi:hypothetical protein GpartN1_g5345.t1 [Galdieria partita]|uniref:Uncharacterized protein n=1 Tax=Galdieria partita TaxID=83374 RepID=A0A9C7URZ6_9RHOD|nr:hypothetical protein GpartN1_g5345.t1 [Galdieria partita]